MTTLRKGMTREEVAAVVCDALQRSGIHAVLSGSSAAAVYAPDAPASMDLDFVVVTVARRVSTAMEELGFHRDRRYWRHTATDFWVDFQPGPVAIWQEIVQEAEIRETEVGKLRLLPPTECVMDRLVYYFDNADSEALEQAVAVARQQDVDLKRIEAWAEKGGFGERYREFASRLNEP
jgi:hypothetical protein